MSDLIERLRHAAFVRFHDGWESYTLAADAATRIEALEKENERLREASKAVIAQWDTPNWKLEQPTAVLIENLRTALRDGGEE